MFWVINEVTEVSLSVSISKFKQKKSNIAKFRHYEKTRIQTFNNQDPRCSCALCTIVFDKRDSSGVLCCVTQIIGLWETTRSSINVTLYVELCVIELMPLPPILMLPSHEAVLRWVHAKRKRMRMNLFFDIFRQSEIKSIYFNSKSKIAVERWIFSSGIGSASR